LYATRKKMERRTKAIRRAITTPITAVIGTGSEKFEIYGILREAIPETLC
jgi:hypothetical protein